MSQAIQLKPGISSLPIIIGGSQLNEQLCGCVQDGRWIKDAMNGVRLCQRLINR